MFTFEAYCDESTGTHEHEAKFYVVAGYMGSAAAWRKFEDAWREALTEEHLSSFHMTDCEKGYGEFAHLRGSEHTEERNRIQRRFITIIKNASVFGVSTAVVLHQFRTVGPVVGRLLDRQFSNPYSYAFRTTLHTMGKQLRDFPADEQISFIFDRNPQYGGRSGTLFNQLAAMESTKFSYRSRLGRLSHESRFTTLPLQAADILAYETFRHLEDGASQQPRWQYEMLLRDRQVCHRVMGWRIFRRLQYLINNHPLLRRGQ